MNIIKTRMDRLFILCVFILTTNILCAGQVDRFDTNAYKKSSWRKNERILSVGIGFFNYDVERLAKLKTTENHTISSVSINTPVYTKLEFSVSRHLGVAMAINFNRLNYNYTYPTIINNQKTYNTAKVYYGIFSFNVRVNYHIFYNKVFDVYLGGGSGLRIGSGSSLATAAIDFYPNGFLKEFELTSGVRYLYRGKIGIYAEAGFSRSIFQAGLSYNFNRM